MKHTTPGEWVLRSPHGLSATVCHDCSEINRQYGPRFENMGRITQVTCEGRDILGRDGMIDETGHIPPHGPIRIGDGQAIKIGVGVIELPETEWYDHRKNYKVIDAFSTKVVANDTSVSFAQDTDFYAYSKRFEMCGNGSIGIVYSFQSRFMRPIGLEQYNHNWLILHHKEDAGIQLPLGVSLEAPEIFRKVGDRYYRYLPVNSPAKTSCDIATTELAQAVAVRIGPHLVEVCGDFTMSRLQFYYEPGFLCPEMFAFTVVRPNELKCWGRTYSFGSVSTQYPHDEIVKGPSKMELTDHASSKCPDMQQTVSAYRVGS